MERNVKLWIGGLEPYMNEKFLINAFSLTGDDDIKTIKFVRNKFTGEDSSYAQLEFETNAGALMCLHKTNGKIIPHSQPPARFKLTAAFPTGFESSEKEFCIWVSDLPEDLAGKTFHEAFETRFETVRSTRVMIEKDGRKYGFVRFGDINDQREALIHMNGFSGFGGNKTIKVTIAVPKNNFSNRSRKAQQFYPFDHEQGNYQQVLLSANTVDNTNDWDMVEIDSDSDEFDGKDERISSEENRLILFDNPINVDSLNAEYIKRSQDVWDSAEKSRWIYNLENEEGFVPNFSIRDSDKNVLDEYFLNQKEDEDL